MGITGEGGEMFLASACLDFERYLLGLKAVILNLHRNERTFLWVVMRI